MSMLEKWADVINDRRTIEEFWDWLESQNLASTDILDINIGKLLDDFHGIDQRQLERERRALLAQASMSSSRGDR